MVNRKSQNEFRKNPCEEKHHHGHEQNAPKSDSKDPAVQILKKEGSERKRKFRNEHHEKNLDSYHPYEARVAANLESKKFKNEFSAETELKTQKDLPETEAFQQNISEKSTKEKSSSEPKNRKKYFLAEAESVCNRLQKTTSEILVTETIGQLRSSLKQCKNEFSLFHAYLSLSEKVSEILNVWKHFHSLKNDKVCVSVIMLVHDFFSHSLASEFLNVDESLSFRHEAEFLANHLLRYHLHELHAHLSSNHIQKINSSLLLLTSISHLSNKHCTNLSIHFDFTLPALIKLANPPKGENASTLSHYEIDFSQPDPDPDSCSDLTKKQAWCRPVKWVKSPLHVPSRYVLIEFLLSFLIRGDGHVIRSVVHKRLLYYSILKFLSYDDPITIVRVLCVFHCRFFSHGQGIPRGLKGAIFGDRVLEQLIYISSADDVSSSDSLNPNELAKETLSKILTDPSHGFLPFQNHSLLSKISIPLNYNLDLHRKGKKEKEKEKENEKGLIIDRVLKVCLKLRVLDVKSHRDLLLEASENFPILAAAYLSLLPFTLEPNPSDQWLIAMSLISRLIVISRKVPSLFKLSDSSPFPSSSPPSPRSPLRFILPSSISKLSLSRGLQHKSNLVKYITLSLILASLTSLEELFTEISTTASARYGQKKSVSNHEEDGLDWIGFRNVERNDTADTGIASFDVDDYEEEKGNCKNMDIDEDMYANARNDIDENIPSIYQCLWNKKSPVSDVTFLKANDDAMEMREIKLISHSWFDFGQKVKQHAWSLFPDLQVLLTLHRYLQTFDSKFRTSNNVEKDGLKDDDTSVDGIDVNVDENDDDGERNKPSKSKKSKSKSHLHENGDGDDEKKGMVVISENIEIVGLGKLNNEEDEEENDMKLNDKMEDEDGVQRMLGQLMHAKLFDVLSKYMRCFPDAFKENRLDPFRLVPFHFSSLSLPEQTSFLKLLFCHVSHHPKLCPILSHQSNRIALPFFGWKGNAFPLYESVPTLLKIFFTAENYEARVQARELVRLAMITTSAFDSNLNEPELWMEFIERMDEKGMKRKKSKIELSDEKMNKKEKCVLDIVCQFLSEIIVKVGRKLHKYLEILYSSFSFSSFEGNSNFISQQSSHPYHSDINTYKRTFGPLAVCALIDCIKIVRTQSKLFSSSHRFAIAFYCSSVIATLMKMQDFPIPMALLIHSIISNELLPSITQNTSKPTSEPMDQEYIPLLWLHQQALSVLARSESNHSLGTHAFTQSNQFNSTEFISNAAVINKKDLNESNQSNSADSSSSKSLIVDAFISLHSSCNNMSSNSNLNETIRLLMTFPSVEVARSLPELIHAMEKKLGSDFPSSILHNCIQVPNILAHFAEMNSKCFSKAVRLVMKQARVPFKSGKVLNESERVNSNIENRILNTNEILRKSKGSGNMLQEDNRNEEDVDGDNDAMVNEEEEFNDNVSGKKRDARCISLLLQNMPWFIMLETIMSMNSIHLIKKTYLKPFLSFLLTPSFEKGKKETEANDGSMPTFENRNKSMAVQTVLFWISQVFSHGESLQKEGKEETEECILISIEKLNILFFVLERIVFDKKSSPLFKNSSKEEEEDDDDDDECGDSERIGWKGNDIKDLEYNFDVDVVLILLNSSIFRSSYLLLNSSHHQNFGVVERGAGGEGAKGDTDKIFSVNSNQEEEKEKEEKLLNNSKGKKNIKNNKRKYIKSDISNVIYDSMSIHIARIVQRVLESIHVVVPTFIQTKSKSKSKTKSKSKGNEEFVSAYQSIRFSCISYVQKSMNELKKYINTSSEGPKKVLLSEMNFSDWLRSLPDEISMEDFRGDENQRLRVCVVLAQYDDCESVVKMIKSALMGNMNSAYINSMMNKINDVRVAFHPHTPIAISLTNAIIKKIFSFASEFTLHTSIVSQKNKDKILFEWEKNELLRNVLHERSNINLSKGKHELKLDDDCERVLIEKDLVGILKVIFFIFVNQPSEILEQIICFASKLEMHSTDKQSSLSFLHLLPSSSPSLPDTPNSFISSKPFQRLLSTHLVLIPLNLQTQTLKLCIKSPSIMRTEIARSFLTAEIFPLANFGKLFWSVWGKEKYTKYFPSDIFSDLNTKNPIGFWNSKEKKAVKMKRSLFLLLPAVDAYLASFENKKCKQIKEAGAVTSDIVENDDVDIKNDDKDIRIVHSITRLYLQLSLEWVLFHSQDDSVPHFFDLVSFHQILSIFQKCIRFQPLDVSQLSSLTRKLHSGIESKWKEKIKENSFRMFSVTVQYLFLSQCLIGDVTIKNNPLHFTISTKSTTNASINQASNSDENEIKNMKKQLFVSLIDILSSFSHTHSPNPSTPKGTIPYMHDYRKIDAIQDNFSSFTLQKDSKSLLFSSNQFEYFLQKLLFIQCEDFQFGTLDQSDHVKIKSFIISMIKNQYSNASSVMLIHKIFTSMLKNHTPMHSKDSLSSLATEVFDMIVTDSRFVPYLILISSKAPSPLPPFLNRSVMNQSFANFSLSSIFSLMDFPLVPTYEDVTLSHLNSLSLENTLKFEPNFLDTQGKGVYNHPLNRNIKGGIGVEEKSGEEENGEKSGRKKNEMRRKIWIVKLLQVLMKMKLMLQEKKLKSARDKNQMNELLMILSCAYNATMHEVDIEIFKLIKSILSFCGNETGGLERFNYVWGMAARRKNKDWLERRKEEEGKEGGEGKKVNGMGFSGEDNRIVKMECNVFKEDVFSAYKEKIIEDSEFDICRCALTILFLPLIQKWNDGDEDEDYDYVNNDSDGNDDKHKEHDFHFEGNDDDGSDGYGDDFHSWNLPQKKKKRRMVVLMKEERIILRACYNPSLLLSFSLHALKKQKLSCRDFVRLGLLSLSFVSIASPSEAFRKKGYEILSIFSTLIHEDTKFAEKRQMECLLTFIRNSITQSFQRLPFLSVLFFAESAFVLLHPDNSLYVTINRFLLYKPKMDFSTIPLFHTIFFSSGKNFQTEKNFGAEKFWILKYLHHGLAYKIDTEIYKKNSVFEIMMSFFSSSMADFPIKRHAMQVLLRACQIESSALYLVRVLGFLPWLLDVVSSSSHPLSSSSHPSFTDNISETSAGEQNHEDESSFISMAIQALNYLFQWKSVVEFLTKDEGVSQLSYLAIALFQHLKSGFIPRKSRIIIKKAAYQLSLLSCQLTKV